MASGRQLCVAGRSLDRIIQVAQASGYLKDLPDIIDPQSAMRLPRGEVMFLATGGQGEARAALGRISEGNHDIALSAGDVVLFSSRQIPGNEIAIGRIQNRLAEQGVTIVTDRQSYIHVSGHPGRPELEALYSPGALKGLTFQANYTYLKTEGKFAGTSLVSGTQLANFIPKALNAGLIYKYRDFGASFDVNYTGEYPLTNASATPGPHRRPRA